MPRKHFLQILTLSLGLLIAIGGQAPVSAECTDQSSFTIKGYCRAENNDGYYIKAGVGMPIVRSGFQCKFLQVKNTDPNNVVFIPLAPGSTGDDEFSSLLTALDTNANISALVSLVTCSAKCDAFNNLVTTVGSSVFTYPCGDYAECVNDASGNGQCVPVVCNNMNGTASGYYQQGGNSTPLIWCPHYPVSRTDKNNGLTAPSITNQACAAIPDPAAPCLFSTCGNGQLDGAEDCDTKIDTSGRCQACSCGVFSPEVVAGNKTGRCQEACSTPPTCTSTYPYVVDCGCSMCPADEQITWPEVIECKMANTYSLVDGIDPLTSGTFFQLPQICKSCGALQSDGTYKPAIRVRIHGYYSFDEDAWAGKDRTISSTCTDFAPPAAKDIICGKTISGGVMKLVQNSSIACPAGTYNDTTENELNRGIMSCNMCNGTIWNSVETTGTPFYYGGACHACQKGLAANNFDDGWTACYEPYGIADLNNDGDLNDPGENLTTYLNENDPDSSFYTSNTDYICDSDKDGLLDADKAFLRYYSSNLCVPYTFCTDTATAGIYPNCTQITDAATLATLQTQKPKCPADLIDPANFPPEEGIVTMCTPCPASYKHINTFIALLEVDGTWTELDYRSIAGDNGLPSKYTCHDKCTYNAPYYYDDGSGAACHPCPPQYNVMKNYWSDDHDSQYILCSKIACADLSLIYDSTNDGVANPTCHTCPQNTFQLATVTNWPVAGSKCWPAKGYCNNTKYPTTAIKNPEGILFRRVAKDIQYYDSPDGNGTLYTPDDSDDPNPPLITDNTIFNTTYVNCACPAGTHYQDNAYNGSEIPDYSTYFGNNIQLTRPTVYCVSCPIGSNYYYKASGASAAACQACPQTLNYQAAGETQASCHACEQDYFYKGTGDASSACHECTQEYFYTATGEAAPSCHDCEEDYFYQSTGETENRCHECTQVEGCDEVRDCTLPQYSCNPNNDPNFVEALWGHTADCTCYCKLSASACTGATPNLNPTTCTCEATITAQYCGNGVLDSGEECDTMDDGESYIDNNGLAHLNRCIQCKIHRISSCDSRAHAVWVSGSYTERPVTGQCPSGLSSTTNNGNGLTAYDCAFWTPEYMSTTLDPTPVHQSLATSSSGCIFTCQSGYTYNSSTKLCQ